MLIFKVCHITVISCGWSINLPCLPGTPAQVKGQDGIILFDTMTHTLQGNSGIGDFGQDGIDTFIRDHTCGEICQRLGLDRSIPLRADSAENQQSQFPGQGGSDEDPENSGDES